MSILDHELPCCRRAKPNDGQPEHRSGATPDTLIFRVVRSSDEKPEFQILVEPTLDDNGAARWFEHPVHGRRVDVVALPLNVATDLGFISYELIDIPETYLRPGSGVSIVGFPFGLTGGGAFGIWTHGFVASEPQIDLDNLPKFLVDARTRRGQSGSPVVGGTSVLLGIYSGRVNEQSDLGIVWKVNALREILRGRTLGHAGL